MTDTTQSNGPATESTWAKTARVLGLMRAGQCAIETTLGTESKGLAEILDTAERFMDGTLDEIEALERKAEAGPTYDARFAKYDPAAPGSYSNAVQVLGFCARAGARTKPCWSSTKGAWTRSLRFASGSCSN